MLGTGAIVRGLTYRLHRESDVPGLLRLWEDETDWGSLDAETWRRWYVDTPHGECLIVVATDEQDAIVAQEVFTPAQLLVAGERVRGLRISAPILSRDLRRQTVRHREHPIVRLLSLGAEIAAAEGYSLMYSLPDPAWLPFFHWLPRLGIPGLVFQAAEFPCVGLPLTAPVPVPRNGDLVAVPCTSPGSDFDDLWSAAVSSFPIDCGVVRDAGWIRYKNGGHLTLELRHSRDDTLIGYTATRRDTAQLVDILARNPTDLVGLLAATTTWLAENGDGDGSRPLTEFKVMETPLLAPGLTALGFEPIDYTFAFVCNRLDPRLPAAAVAPGRWFVTPGD